ncbi:hypothetical protein [Paenibacillus sp.]|jgi:undecaprenyl phosphate-alpha-L-ara4N flippase subunit ArnF|uniref:hypothetical protein n=1 Tax=Paenibacillus sp. TaxID=58172 RepID=UPI00283A7538|nr:hypothetical protein [Paenibacillus sp.]MDR0269060.1 hypothetical protein [Paenibacillus sp.]
MIKNQTAFVILLVVNLIYCATLLAWPVILFTSGFLFDAPGDYDRTWGYVVVIAITAYPLGVIGNFSCWFAYHARKYKLAYWLANIAGIWPASFILLVVGSLIELLFNQS